MRSDFFKQLIQYRESSIKQSPILYKNFALMRGSLSNTLRQKYKLVSIRLAVLLIHVSG